MSHLSPVARRLNQKATYWAKAPDDGYGNTVSVTPEVISVRWEDVTEEKLSVQYRVEGETVTSSARVFTAQVLQEGGYLYLGETTETSPQRLVGAYVIRKTSTIPSLRSNKFENVAYL